MHFIDWAIVGALLIGIVWAAIYTKKYTESVSDFLSANRCARRYLLCISSGMSGIGAISIIAMFEMYYAAGFTAAWWALMMTPVMLIMVLSGWVSYRYRETRVFTLAQFFEVRYSKSFRIFAGILGWSAGIINFGIFPAVGSRFFIYYCGLPEYVPYLGISSYAFVMFLLISISLFFVFLGGQVAVMVTDFIQGMFTNVVLLVILGYILWQFDWSMLIETLQGAPADASMLNPFKTSKLRDFNFFYFFIGAIGLVYGRMAWQGSQGYACSAKNAHEARMGGILGEWRGLVLMLLLLMLPIAAYVVMHNPAFAPIAAQAKQVLDGIDNTTIQKQMTVSVVLSKMFPVGLLGLFCAVMLAAFISTHDTYLHSWGSIFIQDVILPFRKKPFSPKQHIWLLRFSVLFVAVFIFCFGMLFKQNEYILMFFSITGAIFLGGAGACIVGGLYWKRGSTSGAWFALILGCVIAVGGMLLRQSWTSTLYPWMETSAPAILNGLTFVIEGISNNIPGINWKIEAKAFPINSQWIYFLAMTLSMVGYIACSLVEWLVKKRPAFNMDRLLHRGEYAIEGEHAQKIKKPPTGIKAILPSAEFSKSDKFIYYSSLGWTLFWFIIFVGGSCYNLVFAMTDSEWATFWAWKIGITLVIGIGTTIWFFIGGIYDIRDMFHTLKTAKRDVLDDGMVVNHHNLGEQADDKEKFKHEVEKFEHELKNNPHK
ncbi:MAG: sodium:solute symporter family protein [Victivallaceae bacterium]|nr:sodium:solute symporter family protein [Victivallaceae bacterium]